MAQARLSTSTIRSAGAVSSLSASAGRVQSVRPAPIATFDHTGLRGGQFLGVLPRALPSCGESPYRPRPSPRTLPTWVKRRETLTHRRKTRQNRGMLRNRLIRLILALCCATALAAPLGGCGYCGDWPWTAKSCHDEPTR